MNENEFVGYEYTTVVAKRELESFYMDYYPSFGWEFDNRTPSIKGFNWIQLKFKRNRRIEKKTELMKLQRQFESSIEQIQKLEMSKVLKASTVAYIVGIIGTAFMAGSVFSVVGGAIVPCIILGAVGFIGWAASYVSYRNISKNMTDKIEPLIDKKYDEINEICKSAASFSY